MLLFCGEVSYFEARVGTYTVYEAKCLGMSDSYK